MCAFLSMHLEDEASNKMLAYVLNGENSIEICSKKFKRVPEDHKDGVWGKIVTKVEGDPNITPEQKKRYEELKKVLGM